MSENRGGITLQLGERVSLLPDESEPRVTMENVMVSTRNAPRPASQELKPEELRSGGFASEDFKKQLLGYGLTTAEILYRRPDRKWLLQSYVWQNYDLFPKFPALRDFLAFWQEKLEGPLFSVTVAHSRLIRPAELRAINGEFRLH